MQIRNKRDWNFEAAPVRTSSERRAARPVAADTTSEFPAQFLTEGVSIEEVRSVMPTPLRGQPAAPLRLSISERPDERTAVILRHPSGALTFHTPSLEKRTRRNSKSRKAEFEIDLAPAAPARRGWVTSAIKVIVAKIAKSLVDKVVKAGVAATAALVEQQIWRRRDLSEGLFELQFDGSRLKLTPNQPRKNAGRALLFVHGTFSNTVDSFGKLLSPSVLSGFQRAYPGGVFALDHFTFSRTPKENVELLLHSVGKNSVEIDAVGYSRGGLVVRVLAEQSRQFGNLADRLRLRRAVLCATPNRGTPLATSGRWEDTLGLVANLLELFPDNPLTTGAEFVASAIAWMAAHVVNDLPGLAAMNSNGELITELRGGKELRPERYSAIGANFHPQGAIWSRIVDAGIDGFFGGANDLVVPTMGSWTLSDRVGVEIDPDEVASFGFGGNLRPDSGTVNHLDLMQQPETARFLADALSEQAHNLPRIQLRSAPSVHRAWRGDPRIAPSLPAINVPTGEDQTANASAIPRAWGGEDSPAQSDMFNPRSDRIGLNARARGREGDRTLHLLILNQTEPATKDDRPDRRRRPNSATILAIYGGARVVHRLPLNSSGGDVAAGKRFQRIIQIHEQINRSLDGSDDPMPSAEELVTFGECLFSALFVGPILRLYDVARAEQGNEPLNLVITSAIPWLAGKPWEFAWDPNRRKFLATEEVHIVRNVLTAVPAQRPRRERRPLRMLIVEAQPAGTSLLSIDEERERIRHRFQSLLDAGLVEISVLVSARTDSFHDRILQSVLSDLPFDIVHFIGHGEFDELAREGRLLFVEEEGLAPQPVGIQTLREILCNRGIQLVFLNACDTARQPMARDRGIAQSLIEGGIPAVVANQFRVLDPSAVSFAERFYWALAHGASLGEAAREARIAVNYSTTREAIDWAVPVLYARDADYCLCEPPQAVKPMSRGLRPEFVHRRLVTPTKRPAIVGIADLARYFPTLPDILARMNQAQEYFLFREVQVATPVHVWQRLVDPDTEKEKTYLVAREFAESLAATVSSLGVDYLGCITNWWMCDTADGDRDLYGWWSEDSNCPVFVFSTAGLSLPNRGEAAGRVLANEFVSCCGGFLHDAFQGGDIIHESPPRNSVFYYNADRSIESISGQLVIPPVPRKKLLNAIPAERLPEQILEAFDKLLAAFIHPPA